MFFWCGWVLSVCKALRHKVLCVVLSQVCPPQRWTGTTMRCTCTTAASCSCCARTLTAPTPSAPLNSTGSSTRYLPRAARGHLGLSLLLSSPWQHREPPKSQIPPPQPFRQHREPSRFQSSWLESVCSLSEISCNYTATCSHYNSN